MRCPFCGFEKTKVIDKRTSTSGTINRRRRVCSSCKKRFTTHESISIAPIIVVKRNGSREHFDKKKVLEGVIKACEKRPVSADAINRIVSRVELKLSLTGKSDVLSSEIGSLVLEELQGVDEVAYVRFASVYKNFHDAKSFENEVINLKKVGGGLI